jgi:hypothetical protein
MYTVFSPCFSSAVRKIESERTALEKLSSLGLRAGVAGIDALLSSHYPGNTVAVLITRKAPRQAEIVVS